MTSWSTCYTCELYCLYLSILRAFNSPAGELRCTSGSLVSQMSRGRAKKGQGGLARVSEEKLPKAQQTQGTDYFDSFSSFSSKKKLQQAFYYWSSFSFVLFGKGREIHRKKLINLRDFVATLTNPCNN